jgi:hypothetical protein
MRPTRLSRILLIGLSSAGLLVLASCTKTTPTLSPQTAVFQITALVTKLPTSTIAPTFTTEATEPDDTETPEPSETPTPSLTATQTVVPSDTPSPVPTTEVPTPNAQAARNQVVSAFEKLNSAYPFRLTEDTILAGQTLNRIADLQAADISHVTLNNGTAGGVSETIRIGDQLYWKQNGQWSQVDQMPANSQPQVDLGAAWLISGIKNVQFGGVETVNGVPTFVYSFQLLASHSGVTISGNCKAWIGIGDGLPHQADLKGTMASYAVRTRLVYSYGVSFTIQPPL